MFDVRWLTDASVWMSLLVAGIPLLGMLILSMIRGFHIMQFKSNRFLLFFFGFVPVAISLLILFSWESLSVIEPFRIQIIYFLFEIVQMSSMIMVLYYWIVHKFNTSNLNKYLHHERLRIIVWFIALCTLVIRLRYAIVNAALAETFILGLFFVLLMVYFFEIFLTPKATYVTVYTKKGKRIRGYWLGYNAHGDLILSSTADKQDDNQKVFVVEKSNYAHLEASMSDRVPQHREKAVGESERTIPDHIPSVRADEKERMIVRIK